MLRPSKKKTSNLFEFDKKAGGYRRQGDEDDERLSKDNQRKVINHLVWLGSRKELNKAKNKSSKKKIKIKTDSILEETKKLAVLKDQSLSEQLSEAKSSTVPLVSGIASAFMLDRLAKTIKNFAQRRKIRSGAMTVGGMGLGIILGVVIGTVLLPGLGSLIGGAVATAIGAGIGALGGAIGFGLIGGAVGTWGGYQGGKKLFGQKEKHTLPKKVWKKWQKTYGIDKKTVGAMNSYILNRMQTIDSPYRKNSLKLLRQVAIKQMNDEGLNKLFSYFAQELQDLRKEYKRGGLSKEDKRKIKYEMDTLKQFLNLADRPLFGINEVLTPGVKDAVKQAKNPEKYKKLQEKRAKKKQLKKKKKKQKLLKSKKAITTLSGKKNKNKSKEEEKKDSSLTLSKSATDKKKKRRKTK